MSFVEKNILKNHFSYIDIQKEIKYLRDTISILNDKINILESFNNKFTKKLVKDEMIIYILDILLIENEDINRIPENHSSLLLINEETKGNLIYISNNYLEKLCQNILLKKNNTYIEIEHFIDNNIQTKFINNQWII